MGAGGLLHRNREGELVRAGYFRGARMSAPFWCSRGGPAYRLDSVETRPQSPVGLPLMHAAVPRA